jgi:hypothetical protein
MAIPPSETVRRFYGNVDCALDVLKNRKIDFVHISMQREPV